MARVLVTGMSGAGKSTLLGAVAAEGFATVDYAAVNGGAETPPMVG